MPFVSYAPQSGMARQPGGIRVPPKMPPGTGAYPITGSAVRGYVSTGLRESF